MIRVTRLNGEGFALNPDLIERLEAHPDTVAFLADGTKYVVRESVEDVLQLRGSFPIEHTLARRGALKLWELLHRGHTLTGAAQTAGLTVRNARKWAKRYLAQGLHGLADQPGRGRKPVFSPLGRPPLGQDRLRTAGSTRPLLIPVGLP